MIQCITSNEMVFTEYLIYDRFGNHLHIGDLYPTIKHDGTAPFRDNNELFGKPKYRKVVKVEKITKIYEYKATLKEERKEEVKL